MGYKLKFTEKYNVFKESIWKSMFASLESSVKFAMNRQGAYLRLLSAAQCESTKSNNSVRTPTALHGGVRAPTAVQHGGAVGLQECVLLLLASNV